MVPWNTRSCNSGEKIYKAPPHAQVVGTHPEGCEQLVAGDITVRIAEPKMATSGSFTCDMFF